MGLLNKLFNEIKISLAEKAEIGEIPEKIEPIGNLVHEKFKEEKRIEDSKKVMLFETELLLNKLLNEFRLYPFKDKWIKSINVNLPQLQYIFEDKTIANFIFVNNSKFEVLFKDIKYKNYIITSKRLYKLLNEISNFCDTCVERPIVTTYTKPVVENILLNSTKEKYNLIVRQIKLRQEEINKLSKNEKKRLPLENELLAYKKAADRIKSQFK